VQIVRLTRDSYCLEGHVGDAVASMNGPSGNVVPVACDR
jgi:hypothetical protein